MSRRSEPLESWRFSDWTTTLPAAPVPTQSRLMDEWFGMFLDYTMEDLGQLSPRFGCHVGDIFVLRHRLRVCCGVHSHHGGKEVYGSLWCSLIAPWRSRTLWFVVVFIDTVEEQKSMVCSLFILLKVIQQAPPALPQLSPEAVVAQTGHSFVAPYTWYL